MTRKDVKRIHEACERIELGIDTFSCLALEFGEWKDMLRRDLRARYANFFDRDADHQWFGDLGDEEARNTRLTALLVVRRS